MRYAMILLAILTSLVVASTASANQARSASPEANATRKGPVAKLVELEKLKNEWLRQKLGR